MKPLPNVTPPWLNRLCAPRGRAPAAAVLGGRGLARQHGQGAVPLPPPRHPAHRDTQAEVRRPLRPRGQWRGGGAKAFEHLIGASIMYKFSVDICM